jgi:hypothetical protein
MGKLLLACCQDLIGRSSSWLQLPVCVASEWSLAFLPRVHTWLWAMASECLHGTSVQQPRAALRVLGILLICLRAQRETSAQTHKASHNARAPSNLRTSIGGPMFDFLRTTQPGEVGSRGNTKASANYHKWTKEKFVVAVVFAPTRHSTWNARQTNALALRWNGASESSTSW